MNTTLFIIIQLPVVLFFYFLFFGFSIQGFSVALEHVLKLDLVDKKQNNQKKNPIQIKQMKTKNQIRYSVYSLLITR